MSDYAKLEVLLRVSENSDYSDPYINTGRLAAYTTTPDEASLLKVECVTTGSGSTVRLTEFTDDSAVQVAIWNTDTTNFVQATYKDLSGTTCVNKIPAGAIVYVPAVDPDTDMLIDADTASVTCYIALAGS